MVDARFRAATPRQRRAAALLACERAVAAVARSDRAVDDALAALRAGAVPDAPAAARLDALAAALDGEASRLRDGDLAHEREALRAFARARVAGALARAASGDEAEAIYEAIHALDHPRDLPRLVYDILA
jgi:hypothetical protein